MFVPFLNPLLSIIFSMIPKKHSKTLSNEKVLLLFSGGLDTSVILKWLTAECNCEVITFTAGLGQKDLSHEQVKEKALLLGAKKAVVLDLKEEFCNNFIAKAIKANALYQGKYPLATALGRYLIAEKAVEIAKQNNCTLIMHGCTGKGNDQVRLEASINALAPEMKVVSPVRDFSLMRDKEIEYAEKNSIPIPEKSKYSMDENIWGKSYECADLEYPEKEPDKDIYGWLSPLENTPNKPDYVSIEFLQGVPIALNGEKIPLPELIEKLNEIAGKHSVGLIDHIEDRVVGLKSREVYECPAAVCLIEAHKDLEKLVYTNHLNHFKPLLENEWAKLCYGGLWFDPLMNSLNAFIEKCNEVVSGTVILKLFKGSFIVVSRSSKNSLYELNLATYEKESSFNQCSSIGFIELYGLFQKKAVEVQKRQTEVHKNPMEVQKEAIQKKSVKLQKKPTEVQKNAEAKALAETEKITAQ